MQALAEDNDNSLVSLMNYIEAAEAEEMKLDKADHIEMLAVVDKDYSLEEVHWQKLHLVVDIVVL